MNMDTKDAGLEVISVRRNPYLAEYDRNRGRNPGRAVYREGGQGSKYTQAGRRANRRAPVRQRRTRAVKRRQRLRIMCAALLFGVITLTVLGVGLLVQDRRAAAASGIGEGAVGNGVGAGGGNTAGNNKVGGGSSSSVPQGTTDIMVQGIPAEIFGKHPEWEEDFLTPNEYSRPGDELKEVKNIFVHYTANPGTSAAQNRSYFERQKDEHLASVSSHFIIGYDGEIIQCVPLTEIAYAVQTRNFDSVSIECCYKAKDGSFTKETYQSLIALLAWLTEVYDLDTEDILRHYDCGGKKCPLYYTDHPDKWKQLKEDVSVLKENTGVKL